MNSEHVIVLEAHGEYADVYKLSKALSKHPGLAKFARPGDYIDVYKLSRNGVTKFAHCYSSDEKMYRVEYRRDASSDFDLVITRAEAMLKVFSLRCGLIMMHILPHGVKLGYGRPLESIVEARGNCTEEIATQHG